MFYSRLLLTVLAAALFPACGLATGAVLKYSGRTRHTGSGSTCTNYAGKVGPCGADYSQNKQTSSGFDYDTGGDHGFEFHWRFGKHTSKSGDMESSGSTYDLALEYILHKGRIGYSFGIGLSRKGLPDFGEDYRATYYPVMFRLQYNVAPILAPYAGIGYLAGGFWDTPAGFGVEASGYRIVGGVRAGIPLDLGHLDGIFATVEVQRDAARDGVDLTGIGVVGAISVDIAP